MHNVKEYLKLHPDASLKDYVDYTISSEKEYEEKENERYKNCEDWYKGLEGRYFIINFNGSSFCVIKVDKWPSTPFSNIYDCYNIYLQYNGINFEQREVNRFWFNNPYEKNFYGRGATKCKEITKEEYEDIANKSKKIKEILESINLK